jgi:phospholipase C
MDDNFTDNSLEGFRVYRQAHDSNPSSPLVTKGLSSTLHNNNLDGLKADVLAGQLPQVSWIVAPAAYSEHTGPSSPVQGAWYTQQVLESLTASPEVWSKTVLLVMFDENDGFFDHVPSPSAPSLNLDGSRAGASTVDDSTERRSVNHQIYDKDWVYGPGPRVPMYIVSPWSRGGWLCSQTFDHTSILRFLEARFGVAEPNVSAWRRAVCGDLTSAFNFVSPNDNAFPDLPRFSKSEADGLRSSQEKLAAVPIPTDGASSAPKQKRGMRPSRALPYELHATSLVNNLSGSVQLLFASTSTAGAVFHVYDKLHLDRIPRRYTVEAGKMLSDSWSTLADLGRYDLWVLGPNGFHRHFQGSINPLAALTAAAPEVRVCYEVRKGDLYLELHNSGQSACTFTVKANAYRKDGPWTYSVKAGETAKPSWSLADSARWYDFSVTVDSDSSFTRRFAGRVENGKPGITDPAIGNNT